MIVVFSSATRKHEGEGCWWPSAATKGGGRGKTWCKRINEREVEQIGLDETALGLLVTEVRQNGWKQNKEASAN